MEEITIISNYYPPEKGAAANRIEQLALKLHQNNYNITVICPLGNYPQGKTFDAYKGKFYVTEFQKNITIKRLWIYPSVSKNILIRLLSVLSFSSCLFFYLIFKKTSQKIVVQSPPLLLSFIAVFVLSLKNKKIILNVSDLWPLAAIELNALKKGSLSHRFSLFFERYIYKKSAHILGQSNEILAHIRLIYPDKKCFLYRNYPDHSVEKMVLETQPKAPIKLFYAGLLGVAQGVLDLCKNIDLKELNIELHLFGDGAEKNELEQFIASNTNSKIYFHGMLDRAKLHQKIRNYDIAVVPLTTRIYGSVPSKIFEYACLGYPILYFGGGEGETIVNEHQLGWVAKVGDFVDFNRQLKVISTVSPKEMEDLKKGVFDRAKSEFNLNKQMTKLIKLNAF